MNGCEKEPGSPDQPCRERPKSGRGRGAGRPHDFPSKNHSLKSKNSGVREHAAPTKRGEPAAWTPGPVRRGEAQSPTPRWGSGSWPSRGGRQQRVTDHGAAKPRSKTAPENTCLVEGDRGGGSRRQGELRRDPRKGDAAETGKGEKP